MSGVLKYPKISIVTPSFNQGQYLEETIDSVLSQSYPDLEYMVIDGGSKDNSVEIIKKYEKHLTYWVSEKDSGQSNAINKGLTKVTGEIFNWLNSDDFYEKDSLKKVAEAFADPKITMVSGRSRIIDEKYKTLSYTVGTRVYENIYKTIGWARIEQPETFFRVSLIKKMGMLSENLHFFMDCEWLMKYYLITGQDGAKNIPDILVNFRHHASSKTMSRPEGFLSDIDNIYFSIAKQCNLISEAEVIKNYTSLYSGYDFAIPANSSHEILTGAVNYYFLLRANIFYLQNEKDKAASCLSALKVDKLDAGNKFFFKKLLIKNKYLPQWMVKLIGR